MTSVSKRSGPLRFSLLRTMVVSLVVASGLFALLEAAVRLLPSERAKPDARSSMPAFGNSAGAEILAETARLRVEYAPFLLWRLAPNQSGQHFSVDERGFRGPAKCEEGRPRVLLLGGSQAWGVGASSDRATIAGYLEQALAAAGRRACVVNAAEPGYVLRQERIQLFNGLIEERWDRVVVWSGFNDILSALQNRAAGDVQNSERFRRRFDLDPGLARASRDFARQWLSSSRLLEILQVRLSRPSGAARERALSGSDTSVDSLEPLLGAMAREYVHDARIIATVCRDRGIRVTFVLEPCLPVDKTATSAEAGALAHLAESHALYVPAVRAGYVRLREALTQAATEGLEFVDGSKVFAEERGDIYIDEIHMTDRGNRAVAEFLVHHDTPSTVGVR